MRPTDDPRVLLQTMVAEARREFAADVDGLIVEIRRFSRSLGDAVGEISRDEAIAGLERFVREKFDRRISLTSVETETLRGLVVEAYDWMSNPRSKVDLATWKAVAEPFVKGDR